MRRDASELRELSLKWTAADHPVHLKKQAPTIRSELMYNEVPSLRADVESSEIALACAAARLVNHHQVPRPY